MLIQVAGFILAVGGASSGVAVVMAKLIDRWLSERFRHLESRLNEMHAANQRDLAAWQQVERDVMALRAELPERFVLRQEDIRRHDDIQAKLEILFRR